MTDVSQMSDSDLMSALSASAPQASSTLSPVEAIHQLESSGAPDSSTVVNPASGATGSMQVTASGAGSADPGFGVTPSNGTAADNARVGRDYYAALEKHYGDPTTAAIAYNWGPSKTDNWIKSGSDLSKLPSETLKYAIGFQQKTGLGQQAQQSGPSIPGVTDLPNVAAQPSASAQQQSALAAQAPGNVTTTQNPVMMGARDAIYNTLNSSLGLLNKGAQFIAPNSQFAQDVAQGQKDLAATNAAQNQAYDSGQHSVGGKALRLGTDMAGTAFTTPMTGGGIGSLAAQGAAIGALQNPDNAGTGAAIGAAGGAAGGLLGSAIGSIAGSAAPTVNSIKSIFTGGQNVAAANIGSQLGSDIDPAIQALRANSGEIIPGSLPTAAEAANNPAIVQAQRAAQNTAAGQVAFPARQAANNDARFSAGDQVVQPTVGPQLSDELANFTQQQQSRITAGQAELPAVTDAQAQAMQTPAYIQSMQDARNLAANRGSQAFSDQSQGVNQQLAQGIQGVSGTPQTISALRAARSVQAADDFLATQNSVPSSVFGNLAQRPTFEAAAQKAQRQMADANVPIFASDRDAAMAQIGGKNVNYNGQYVTQIKKNLDDFQNQLTVSGSHNDARVISGVRDAFVQRLDDALPGYAQARANYAAASGPIDAQQALQQRLVGAVDPLTGNVSPGTLRATINGVTREQMRPGFRAADHVQPDQMQALQALGQQAQAAPTNLSGLNGEGQEYFRQALAQRAAKGGDAVPASEGFNQQLAEASPNYQQYFEQQSGRGANLQSRQQLQEALDKLRLAGNNASGAPVMGYQAAKANLREPLTGGAEQFRQGLLQDLQRATTANASLGAAGSQTAANQQLGQGLLGHFINSRLSDSAIGAAAATGRIPTAVIALMARKAVNKASEKTEQASIDLLLNPKKLASALEEFKGSAAAKEAFITGIKAKAANAGKVGIRAVQTYEAIRNQ